MPVWHIIYQYILYHALVMLSHFVCAHIFKALYFLSLHSPVLSVSLSHSVFCALCMYALVHFLIEYLYLSDSASQIDLPLAIQYVSQLRFSSRISLQWYSYTTAQHHNLDHYLYFWLAASSRPNSNLIRRSLYGQYLSNLSFCQLVNEIASGLSYPCLILFLNPKLHESWKTLLQTKMYCLAHNSVHPNQ